jgi:UDP-hydrolysing UDP-N-acetyl-D-glucosamine 2-epimerase
MVLEGENVTTMAKSTGLGLVELATVLDNLQPDIVVSVADRFETLATAVAASYMNIPTVHVQGGEVTGSIDEKVRHAVTKLADLHFVSTAGARERVLRMGEYPDRVWLTGCPSIDIAAEIVRDPVMTVDPFAAYGGSGPTLDLSDGYVIVLQHPVTTEHAEAFGQASETLNAVAELDVPVLWFWPNVDAGSDGTSKSIRVFRERHGAENMHFFRNMPPEDFLRVALASRAIVGNSSVAVRECSYLGIPAVNIGSRQTGRERGRNVVDVEHDRSAIKEACLAQMAVGRYEPDRIYGDGRAGPRIADLLATVELSITKRLSY